MTRRSRCWHRALVEPEPAGCGLMCETAGRPAILHPPAVLFRYSADRKGEHPARHLRAFRGVLQVDGYAGFDRLFDDDNPAHPRREAACWAHVRRKFYDLQVATGSPVAAEALRQIAVLYQIEDSLRGQSPPTRQAVRQARAGPLRAALHRWLHETLASVAQRSTLAGVIRYALPRWRALTCYCDDGRIEIDNNAAERALRGVALGRKNYLFAGADCGGERAATLYSLIETAKLNGLDPRPIRVTCSRTCQNIQAIAWPSYCHGTSPNSWSNRPSRPQRLDGRRCDAGGALAESPGIAR